MTTPEVDLFGNSVTSSPVPQARSRPVTNDMDLIERVLAVACAEGYALIGTTERVYRVGAKDISGAYEVTGVPAEEAVAVHQLIDTKNLVVGGTHAYRYRNHRETTGRVVLVPRQTRTRTARWAALHRPSSWPTATERKET